MLLLGRVLCSCCSALLFVCAHSLVFQPNVVLSAIADCVGATISHPLRYQVKTSKGHGSGTTFVKAIVKTADAAARMHNLTTDDRNYLQQHLDPALLKLFHYRLDDIVEEDEEIFEEEIIDEDDDIIEE